MGRVPVDNSFLLHCSTPLEQSARVRKLWERNFGKDAKEISV